MADLAPLLTKLCDFSAWAVIGDFVWGGWRLFGYAVFFNKAPDVFGGNKIAVDACGE